MKQAYQIIPVYTADVSGVCSALYELGGMTVMHDPSGCNSTYNTHDEIRWYHQDSLIFISGLTERDAILGNDKKFLRDVVSAARQLEPRFIALTSSPIPFLNGTDFYALARLIERETGISTFFVPTSGMHDYVQGAGMALAEVARRFVAEPDGVISRSVNLLGMTPLDFAGEGSVEALRQRMTDAGWKVVSCWAMGDPLDVLARAGAAQVNLVTSSVGLAAAKVLKERFGTPYVVGAPIGGFAEAVFAAMEQAGATGADSVPYLSRPEGKAQVTLIGEPVTMGSLAAEISRRYGVPTRVLCPLEQWNGLLAPGDSAVAGEEAAAKALAGAAVVVADPLYRPVCSESSRFYELPHQAFSGRCFRTKMPNLFEIWRDSNGTERHALG